MSGEEKSVGSVAEEAAKLIGALQDWARETGSDYANAAASAAAGAATTASSINEHIATGGKDCRYCPICQVISAIRATSPEVKLHLTSAAMSVLQAAAAAMATAAADSGEADSHATFERIDLEDDSDA